MTSQIQPSRSFYQRASVRWNVFCARRSAYGAWPAQYAYAVGKHVISPVLGAILPKKLYQKGYNENFVRVYHIVSLMLETCHDRNVETQYNTLMRIFDMTQTRPEDFGRVKRIPGPGEIPISDQQGKPVPLTQAFLYRLRAKGQAAAVQVEARLARL